VFGMAMAYDVLYAEFRDSVRELLRSTIARVVSGRRSWGMGLQDTRLASKLGTLQFKPLACKSCNRRKRCRQGHRSAIS
jgi:hypothetical protein